MANITELLEEINTAVYGEDVREAIHDAIEQCYEDATGNPSSVSALVQDVTELQTFASNLFTFVGVTSTNLACPANQVTAFSQAITVPSGYTPAAIAAFWVKTHELTCTLIRADVDSSGTLYFRIRNSSTVDSWTDVSAEFRVLCIKNFT